MFETDARNLRNSLIKSGYKASVAYVAADAMLDYGLDITPYLTPDMSEATAQSIVDELCDSMYN